MKVLFYISKIYSIPVIEPLQAYLAVEGSEFAFYVSNKVYRNLPEKWRAYPIFQQVEEAIAFCPQFVIVPGNFVDFRIPGKKVQVFHGIGIEKPSHYKIRHFFDIYCTSGPAVTNVYNRLQKKYKYFLVRETGWPKIDWIKQYSQENIRQKLNIPEDKKVILFAPTLSRKMESASSLLPEISSCLARDRLWLIKFHELMKKEIKELAGRWDPDLYRVVDTGDITPYLHAADVMVSDTSSVIYEFMALDKPVITYRTIARPDKGINILQPAQLEPALKRAFADQNEHHSNRVRHLEDVNPRLDGKISEFLFKLLAEIDEKNLWAKKRNPLNLFRRMQVLYHEKFKKGYLR